jgi:methionyl aminopeptidase
MSITIKTPDEIEKMRIAGRLAPKCSTTSRLSSSPASAPAKSTKLCHDYMVNVQGCIPAPLNYAPPGYKPYPKSICTSVNHQVCHGVPNEKVILKKGDIVNLDITVIKDGLPRRHQPHVHRRRCLDPAKRLCKSPTNACGSALPRSSPAPISATSATPSRSMRKRMVSRSSVNSAGTASGATSMKTPRCCITARPGTGIELKPGMIFTIEPMINAGKAAISELPDGWTIVTKDRSLSAQWEHMVLVTDTGVEVLTLSAGSPARPDIVAHLLP